MVDESSLTRFHGLNKKLDGLVGGSDKNAPMVDKIV